MTTTPSYLGRGYRQQGYHGFLSSGIPFGSPFSSSIRLEGYTSEEVAQLLAELDALSLTEVSRLEGRMTAPEREAYAIAGPVAKRALLLKVYAREKALNAVAASREDNSIDTQHDGQKGSFNSGGRGADGKPTWRVGQWRVEKQAAAAAAAEEAAKEAAQEDAAARQRNIAIAAGGVALVAVIGGIATVVLKRRKAKASAPKSNPRRFKRRK